MQSISKGAVREKTPDTGIANRDMYPTAAESTPPQAIGYHKLGWIIVI
jgi:hypothetical protein